MALLIMIMEFNLSHMGMIMMRHSLSQMNTMKDLNQDMEYSMD